MCELYAMFGSLFGCASIWTMTMIALDRYNVIVKVKLYLVFYNFILDTLTNLTQYLNVFSGFIC